MNEDLGGVSDDVAIAADLAVIGAGPAGIVVALEAAQQGISVVLLESGGRAFDQSVQELAEAAEWDRRRHAPLSLSTRRQVGGTSNIWGGRCVPFDPVDFLSRPTWALRRGRSATKRSSVTSNARATGWSAGAPCST